MRVTGYNAEEMAGCLWICAWKRHGKIVVPTCRKEHETVLVVEDNDLVLELVVEMMKDLGYHVLTAIDAHSALWIIQHDDRIQLLFTDVMMPDQMNGIDLARAARRCRPES